MTKTVYNFSLMMDKPEDKYQNISDYLKLGFKGFCMGIANAIPGISGGTIAFIFGIYEDLINSIRSLDMTFLGLIGKRQWTQAFQHISWQFFGTVLAGILIAIFTFSKIITWLLQNTSVLVHAFFFGLILASAPIIGRTIKKWSRPLVVLGCAATLGMYYLVGLVPVHTPETLWFLFLCGAIAICTMILPGISGAFILVLLGKYQYILGAVNERDFIPLAAVAMGCVVGILTFVRVLHWLLNRYYDPTVMILTGLVLGSLRKVWPWKETLRVITTHKGKIIPVEQINILPSHFSVEFVWAVVLCVTGFGAALLLGQRSPRGNKGHAHN